ncbi:hypothetical protein U1Q18_032417 [Sarracenia purpurea var. burkii]
MHWWTLTARAARGDDDSNEGDAMRGKERGARSDDKEASKPQAMAVCSSSNQSVTVHVDLGLRVAKLHHDKETTVAT